MNIEFNIDDDVFDKIFFERLKKDFFMLKNDLDNWTNHPDDMKWMIPVKNALETLILMYYSDPKTREEFINEVKNGS